MQTNKNKKNVLSVSENGEVVIYSSPEHETLLEVKLVKDTVWLNLNQLSQLFNRDKSVISRHIKNIFSEKELSSSSTVANFATVEDEGERKVERQIEYYNLDVIISVGYRVKSKQGTQFRIWATKRLKEYLIQGYAINQQRLQSLEKLEFQKTVGIIQGILKNQELGLAESKGLLEVVLGYAGTWLFLKKYDEGLSEEVTTHHKDKEKLTIDYARKAVKELKDNLLSKGLATEIFGIEREHQLDSIISNLYQTFGGQDLYSTLELKAANLFYQVIKDHPFVDGNKRVGCYLFTVFLHLNNALYNKDQTLRITDTVLVALALMIAESNPKDKELVVKIIIYFMNWSEIK